MRFSRSIGVSAVFAVIVVSGAAAFGFTDDSQTLPSGTSKSTYRAQLHARNGCPPYTFHMSGSSPLPAGLSLTADGVIAGVPAALGRSDFWLAVHDSCGGDSQRPFSITIYPAPPAAEVGVAFKTLLTATGAPDEQNTWSLASGALPPGVSLDPSGSLTGTPTAAGSFALELGVFNPHHLIGQLASLELTVVISPRPAILTTRLQRARVRNPYRATLTTNGGTPPMTWSVAGGELPRGLRLNSRSGAVIGSARKLGTYRFAVTVRDRFGQIATRRLTLIVS